MKWFSVAAFILLFLPQSLLSQTRWTWQKGGLGGDPFHQIYWLGDHFAAIDAKGGLISSQDGQNWKWNEAASRLRMGSIFKAAEGFVSIGQNGRLLWSRNGRDWRPGSTYPMRMDRINWTGSFYVGGWWREFWFSPDGENWTSTLELPDAEQFNLFVSGNGRVLAPFTLDKVRLSEDGKAWRNGASPTYSGIYEMVWTGTSFIAIDGKRVVYSTRDGLTWDSLTSIQKEEMSLGLIWTGTRLIGSDKDTVLISENGREWTRRARIRTSRPPQVGFPGLDFARVGVHDEFCLSEDGLHWGRVPAMTAEPEWNSVAWVGNRFIAVGDSGAIATSQDGTAWQAQPSGTWKNLKQVAWSGNLIVTLAEDGILTSSDGALWTPAALPAGTGPLTSLAWTGSAWVAAGLQGTLLTSPDGRNWTLRWTKSSDSLLHVFSNGSITVVTGPVFEGMTFSGTYYYTSTDAINWTRRTSSALPGIGHAAWDGQRFVSILKDYYLTSRDGIEWVSQQAPRNRSGKIYWLGHRFLRIDGALSLSEHGFQWDEVPLPSYPGLQSVAWNEHRFVAAGSRGLILTAPKDAEGSLRVSTPFRAGEKIRSLFSNGRFLVSPRSGPEGWEGLPFRYDFSGRKAFTTSPSSVPGSFNVSDRP